MGYLMHITKREHWYDDTPEKITTEEWRRVIVADPDFELWDGETDVYRLKGCDINIAIFFDEEDGSIDIRSGYFEEVLPKVLEVASRLGAVVEGDEGEFYLMTERGRETTYERPGRACPG